MFAVASCVSLMVYYWQLCNSPQHLHHDFVVLFVQRYSQLKVLQDVYSPWEPLYSTVCALPENFPATLIHNKYSIWLAAFYSNRKCPGHDVMPVSSLTHSYNVLTLVKVKAVNSGAQNRTRTLGLTKGWAAAMSPRKFIQDKMASHNSADNVQFPILLYYFLGPKWNTNLQSVQRVFIALDSLLLHKYIIRSN